MSHAESPVDTIKKFDLNPQWRSASEKALAADFLSINCETNLFLNPAYYEEKDGKLWDPKRETNVAGSAINADETEENIIKQIEEWFLTHDSGLALYISPRKSPTSSHPGYPGEQATIYRIGYELMSSKTLETKKVLFFTSHQFEAHFDNPDEIRKFIFTEDDKEESVISILNWLSEISQKDIQTKIVNFEERMAQAKYFAHQYKSGISINTIIYEMQQTKFLGENAIGCGGATSTTTPSYSNESTTSSNNETAQFEGWHQGICRVCGISTWVGPCSICAHCASKM